MCPAGEENDNGNRVHSEARFLWSGSLAPGAICARESDSERPGTGWTQGSLGSGYSLPYLLRFLTLPHASSPARQPAELLTGFPHVSTTGIIKVHISKRVVVVRVMLQAPVVRAVTQNGFSLGLLLLSSVVEVEQSG